MAVKRGTPGALFRQDSDRSNRPGGQDRRADGIDGSSNPFFCGGIFINVKPGYDEREIVVSAS